MMNSTLLTLTVLLVYFVALVLISRRGTVFRGGAISSLNSRNASRCSKTPAGVATPSSGGNDAFFRGGRRSSWLMVAFGMIGASVSGVSFISVPGWVATTGMTYLQMCAGFFFGYLAVAFVLLPLYYRLRLTSIYDYLGRRFGPATHRTGALFFLLSKLTGAAARLYVVCLVLTQFIVPPHLSARFPALSFGVVAAAVLLLIWLYTRRSGIFTLVRTDALQTACLLLCVVAMLLAALSALNLSAGGAVRLLADSGMGRVFCWDAASPQNFWRQFVSGIFVVVVMTGLDQDMMQKNLTCRNLRAAQKNMCLYGACFLPFNLLLLALGVLLYALCDARGLPRPAGDALLPALVGGGVLGTAVVVPFVLGTVAAAFSSADSALTSLTTSCCVDLLRLERRGLDERRQLVVRRRVHVVMSLAFLVCVILFRAASGTNLINTIYVMVSYTYGPLLGLYAYGLYSRRPVRDALVPFAAIAAPLLCALLDHFAPLWWGYTFGYELLLLNGLLTMAGLALLSRPEERF